MSAQMQQHKAQVRKTMRQAASENTFSIEELAEELKDAKNCLTRATRPHVKALLAAQIRYAAAEELRLLSGDDAPANVPNDRMSFSEDATNLAADLAEAKTLLGRAKRQETKSRLVAYVRAATAREVDVLAAQNTPKAEPSKEREPQDDAPKAEAAGFNLRIPRTDTRDVPRPMLRAALLQQAGGHGHRRPTARSQQVAQPGGAAAMRLEVGVRHLGRDQLQARRVARRESREAAMQHRAL